MKKIIFIILILVLIFGCFFVKTYKKLENDDYLRFHIRANSNSSFDQYVKYEVKDKIISLLEPVLKNTNSYSDAYEILSNSQNLIEEYVNNLLKKYKCDYDAKIKIGEEYFDKKEVDGFILQEGIYNAMIVSLGQGKGNNWWCLVYPSLSFIPTNKVVDYTDILYRSKFVEIYNNIK